jgi:hypothetical protein
MKWFKHAFAIEAPGCTIPTEAQRAIIEKLCREVVRRRMTTPALMTLEMGRPLNYVSAQLLHFFQPMLSFLANAADYQAFTEFLEQRGSIDYIVQRLETLNQEASTSSHATD